MLYMLHYHKEDDNKQLEGRYGPTPTDPKLLPFQTCWRRNVP